MFPVLCDDPVESCGAVQGLKDPEAKRKAIGAGFIEVFNDFAKGFERKPRFLVQVQTSLLRWLHTIAHIYASLGNRLICLPLPDLFVTNLVRVANNPAVHPLHKGSRC